MNQEHHRQLMRFVHGELSVGEEAELRQLIESDPEAKRALRRLETAWRRIPDEPGTGVPAGFADEVLRRASGVGEPTFPTWSLVPSPARWAGLAAATSGVLIGIALAPAPRATAPAGEIVAVTEHAISSREREASGDGTAREADIAMPETTTSPTDTPEDTGEPGAAPSSEIRIAEALPDEAGVEELLFASPSLAESYWDFVAPGDGTDGRSGNGGG